MYKRQSRKSEKSGCGTPDAGSACRPLLRSPSALRESLVPIDCVPIALGQVVLTHGRCSGRFGYCYPFFGDPAACARATANADALAMGFAFGCFGFFASRLFRFWPLAIVFSWLKRAAVRSAVHRRVRRAGAEGRGERSIERPCRSVPAEPSGKRREQL